MKDYTFHSSSFHRINVVLILSVLYMLFFLTACPKVIDIEKKSIIRITGTVTDKNTGLSIVDANVRLFFNSYDRKDSTLKSTKTDSSGQYYLEYDGPIRVMAPPVSVQFSSLSLECRAEGYSPRYTLIVEAIELQTRDFQLTPII